MEGSREEGGRKRVRLSTDLEKAHLIRLCINNFGRYEGARGRGKFFQSIGQLFEKEFNTKAPDVKSWMSRQENKRRKEVDEGEFYYETISAKCRLHSESRLIKDSK